MDTLGETVIYIDAAGVTHEALVFGQNPLNPKLLDLVYVDAAAPPADNIRKVFAIEHHEAKKETNPDLPAYALNAWKEYYEEHGIIPPDHPNFDHKFKQPDLGLNGQPIPINRPITSAFEKAHQEMVVADLSKEDAEELKALSGTGGMFGGITESARKASGPDAVCAECGAMAMSHTVAAAKGDVGMDHDFVEKTPTPPVTSSQPASTDLSDVSSLVTLTGTQTLTNKTLTLPKPGSFTVATLPAASSNTGAIAIVTDAGSAGSCTVGAGSNLSLCRSNGTSWVPLGDGGSGGGNTTSTEGLQAAIEGIAGTEQHPETKPPADPGTDGGDPPNCQPGQLC